MAENKPNQSNVPKSKLNRKQELNLRNSKKLFPKEQAMRAVKRYANNKQEEISYTKLSEVKEGKGRDSKKMPSKEQANLASEIYSGNYEKRKSKTNPSKNQVSKRSDLKKGTTNEQVDFAKKRNSNKTNNKSKTKQDRIERSLRRHQATTDKRIRKKNLLQETMKRTMPAIPEDRVLSDKELKMRYRIRNVSNKSNNPNNPNEPNKSTKTSIKENKESTGVAQSNDSGITPKKNHFLSKIADLAKPSTRTMTSKGYNSLNNDEKKETKKKVQKKSGRKSYHKL